MRKKSYLKSLLLGFLIALSGVVLVLLPGVLSIPKNPTGYYNQKAFAQLCYNSNIVAGEEGRCNDTDQRLNNKKCYDWNAGDRQGNGRGYREVPCPVPTSFNPDRDPVCTTNNGRKVNCPSSARKGRCYTLLTNRQGNYPSERQCTTEDIPSYDPFADDQQQDRERRRNEPPKCYNTLNEIAECPESIAKPENNGKCFKQPAGGRSFNPIPCETIQNTVNDDPNSQPPEEAPSCTERMGLSVGWIVCGILKIISDGITGIFNMADAMLDIDGQNLYVNDQLRQIWSYFRVVATLSLVIITLVMVISQAIGGGL